MALGPSKYDDLVTIVREKSEAAMAIVVVVGGNKGSGFAVQGPIDMTGPVDIAKLLRVMADDIERSMS